MVFLCLYLKLLLIFLSNVFSGGSRDIRAAEWSTVTCSFFVHVFPGMFSQHAGVPQRIHILVLSMLWNQTALAESAVLSRWRCIVKVVFSAWGHVLHSDKTSRESHTENEHDQDWKVSTTVRSIAPYNMAYPGTWTSHNLTISAQSLHHPKAYSDSTFPSSLSEVPCRSCCQVVVESKDLDEPCPALSLASSIELTLWDQLKCLFCLFPFVVGSAGQLQNQGAI